MRLHLQNKKPLFFSCFLPTLCLASSHCSMEDESVNCFLDQNSLVVFITPRRSLHTDTHSCNDEHLVSLQQIDVPNRLSKQSQVRLDKKSAQSFSQSNSGDFESVHVPITFPLDRSPKTDGVHLFKASSKKKSVVLFFFLVSLSILSGHKF